MAKRKSQVEVSPASQTEVSVARVSSFRRFLKNCGINLGAGSPSSTRSSTGLSSSITLVANTDTNKTLVVATTQAQSPNSKAHSRSIKYIFLSPFRSRKSPGTSSSAASSFPAATATGSEFLASGIHSAARIAVAHATHQPLPHPSRLTPTTQQSQPDPSPDPDELQLAIKELQEAHAKAQAERWPYTDRIAVVLRILNEYSLIVDVAISSNPTIAALVWSGIRLILSVALNHLNYLDHMELMMTTVVDKLAVCQFYERIYAGVALDATLEQESSKKNMRENLGKALGLFYVAIQEFVQEATSFFNVSLKTLFVPFAQKMQPLLDVIKERENELRKFADLATMQNVKDMTAKLENMQSTLEVIKKGMTWSDKLQDMESSLTKLLQEQHRAVKSTMEVKEIAKEILQKLDDGQMKNRPDVIKLSFSLGFEAPWPSRHNNDFVGRAYLLAQLDTQIKEGQGTPDCNHIVLYGTGGMGKTQLALEYVYRHHKEYTSVFWVNAASTQTLHRDFIDIMQRLIKHHALLTTEADFTRIGQLLGMSGKLDTAGAFILQAGEEKHVVNAVLEYLSHPGNNKWLLVVDNYDDIESVDIDDYTPTCHHGTVIITTRRAQCIQGRRGFEVEQMRGSEAETLLLKSAKRNWSQITDSTDLKNQKAAVKKLLEKLGYVPLAIDQAGAYIHVNKHTFARYLEDYEANVAYFLKRNSKMGKRERSVFAAWELSFEAIKSQNPNAAELLLVCGFLGNDDLCDELLRRGKKLPNSDMSLRESIQLLFSYSFANRKDKEDSFSIHPLVHEWARRRLESDTKAFTDKAIEGFLLVTSAITQPPNVHRGVKDWIFERRVMHHIAAVEGHMKQGEPMIDKPEILTAACQLARIHMQHGRYELSLEWYKAALGANEKLLGPEHQDSLTTIHQIGLVYSAQDAYDDALKWFTRALEGREKVLGLENVETLQTVHEMAAVFNRKGQYNKAVEWFTRALTGRSKELGEDHLETLMTVNNLALVQQNLGHYSEALEGYKRALAGREKALGSDHPETLTTVNNMASIFSKLGQHDVALEWYQRALSGKEKSMGKDHPSVLTTVHNIGILFAIKAKYDIALEWYQRALTGMAKSLGAENPLTLNTTHDIGSLYQDKAQYEKAIEWYRRALAGREKSLGSSHPHTLSTVNNMAAVFSEQRKFDLALQWYNRALEGNEKRLGADHLDTLATVHNIATVLRNQGKYDEALTYYQRALAGYEKSMGPEDSSTLTIVSSIATIFNLQQHHDKALEWYTRAVQGLEKSLGAKHPQTLAIVTNIATVYDQQQDYDTALQWYNRSLAGLEEEPGVEHPTTLTTMYNIASIFDKTGQCEKAMDMYKRTLAGQEKIFGITHPDTLDTMHDIAVVYEDMNELDDSVEWFERVLDARSDAFGDANESTQETLQGLIQVLGKLGQTARVGELQKRLVQQSPPEA